MKVRISKTFDFDAAHRLPKLPRHHKCSRLHGHTYKVELICVGKPDRRGFVVDYAELSACWSSMHALLDHQFLNDIRGLKNPTTEVLAAFIYRRLKLGPLRRILKRVRVYESTTTYCEVPA